MDRRVLLMLHEVGNSQLDFLVAANDMANVGQNDADCLSYQQTILLLLRHAALPVSAQMKQAAGMTQMPDSLQQRASPQLRQTVSITAAAGFSSVVGVGPKQPAPVRAKCQTCSGCRARPTFFAPPLHCVQTTCGRRGLGDRPWRPSFLPDFEVDDLVLLPACPLTTYSTGSWP